MRLARPEIGWARHTRFSPPLLPSGPGGVQDALLADPQSGTGGFVSRRFSTVNRVLPGTVAAFGAPGRRRRAKLSEHDWPGPRSTAVRADPGVGPVRRVGGARRDGARFRAPKTDARPRLLRAVASALHSPALATTKAPAGAEVRKCRRRALRLGVIGRTCSPSRNHGSAHASDRARCSWARRTRSFRAIASASRPGVGRGHRTAAGSRHASFRFRR